MTFILTTDSSSAHTAKMAVDDTGRGKSLAEDVSDFIYMIDPEETPLLTMLKKKRASSVSHEWLSDALDSAASNAKQEGELYAAANQAARTRYRNPCQISWRAYEVSGSMEVVSQYGIKSEMAHEAVKKMKELKLDVDLDLWQNASNDSTSGSSMSARNTEGYHAMISANAVPDAASGTAQIALAAVTGDAAELQFNLIVSEVYASGPKSDVCFMLPSVKRLVSRWTGVATKFFNQDDRTFTNIIDFYESDFGTIRFVMDRNMQPITQLSQMMVVGDFSKSAIAYLRPFRNKRVPVPKDAHAGVVEVEYCNEYGHPGSYGYMKAST